VTCAIDHFLVRLQNFAHPPDFSVFCCLVQELPLLFLKGGAIVPTGPVVQHVGEAKLTDTITLLVALDDKGKLFMVFNPSLTFFQRHFL